MAALGLPDPNSIAAIRYRATAPIHSTATGRPPPISASAPARMAAASGDAPSKKGARNGQASQPA